MPEPVTPLPASQITPAIDRAGRLASMVQRRSEAKDYIDIDAFMSTGIDLPTALAAAGAIFGTVFNPLITLKALCFFEDGDLPTLPADVRQRLVDAVAAVDLDHLPSLSPVRRAEGAA